MWSYKQSTGELFRTGSPVTTPVAVGHAGVGTGKNNPDLQCVQDIGPIPRGDWTISALTDTPSLKGALPLTPKTGTDVCGRKDFFIHGDSVAQPGWASQGCIILPKEVRELIAASGDLHLRVVA